MGEVYQRKRGGGKSGFGFGFGCGKAEASRAEQHSAAQHRAEKSAGGGVDFVCEESSQSALATFLPLSHSPLFAIHPRQPNPLASMPTPTLTTDNNNNNTVYQPWLRPSVRLTIVRWPPWHYILAASALVSVRWLPHSVLLPV